MGLWIYEYTKNHFTVHFKMVDFMAYEFCFSKYILEVKKRKKENVWWVAQFHQKKT